MASLTFCRMPSRVDDISAVWVVCMVLFWSCRLLLTVWMGGWDLWGYYYPQSVRSDCVLLLECSQAIHLTAGFRRQPRACIGHGHLDTTYGVSERSNPDTT